MEILGVDIGGSGIKGSPVNIETGELLAERYRIATPQPATPQAVADALKELVQHFKWKGKIGAGFPAVVRGGVVETAANIDPSWIGTPVCKLFTKVTGCDTHVVNDADSAGVAEIHFGAGRGVKGVVIMITVGTGLGTAVFIDGKLVPNTEFGHLFYKGMIAEHYTSDAVRKDEDLDWDQWGKRFNKYLKHLAMLTWPDLIIVGGGASKKFERFSDQIKVNTRVVPAQLLNEAGLIGAAMFAAEDL
ncbi:MAG: ROK family protein [Candidatus Omnitrophica bacterium]|nr:ROK family protein [Candidatus Omnitrophota bacterium]